MDSLHVEALKFIDEVEEAFLHTNDYDNKLGLFLSALKTHNDGVISTEALVMTIKNLLEGHENLLSWYRNKFEPKFPQPQTPDFMVTDDRQNPEELNAESCRRKCDEFLRRVKDRFSADDDDVVIYSKVLDALSGEENEIKLIYTELSTLLSGRADLFREFYSLMKFGASEETRLKLQNDLLWIKEDRMYNVDAELEQYRLTIKAVKEGAERLSAFHCRCIERMFFMGYEDAAKKRLMNDFVKKMREDPKVVCNAVLHRLEKRKRELSLRKRSVAEFFKEVFSHSI